MLPVFLEDIRKSDDLDYISLKMIQGINRWEYSQQMEKYTFTLLIHLKILIYAFTIFPPRMTVPKEINHGKSNSKF